MTLKKGFNESREDLSQVVMDYREHLSSSIGERVTATLTICLTKEGCFVAVAEVPNRLGGVYQFFKRISPQVVNLVHQEATLSFPTKPGEASDADAAEPHGN